jgi:hypothetical protein
VAVLADLGSTVEVYLVGSHKMVRDFVDIAGLSIERRELRDIDIHRMSSSPLYPPSCR